MSASAATWIAADWGTTHLRVWAMSDSGTVLDKAQSDDGMGRLARDDFPAALDRLTADWSRARSDMPLSEVNESLTAPSVPIAQTRRFDVPQSQAIQSAYAASPLTR